MVFLQPQASFYNALSSALYCQGAKPQITIELQESELLEARRQLAVAQGELSVSENAEAALMAAREDARVARQQHEVTRQL